MLILLGLLIFTIGFVIWFFGAISKIFVGLAQILGSLIYVIHDHLFVLRRYKKTTYYQNKVRQELEFKINKELQAENFRREQILGAMNFVSKLRINYPFANEAIFQNALDQLPRPTCNKSLDYYENLAKQSHLINLKKQSNFQQKSSKAYTLKDIESLNPIEVRTELPIVLSLYKINEDYVLQVNNTSTKENSLFQTQNYALIVKYMLDVVELQQKLHQAKISIVATQLEEMFNKKAVKDDVFIRRNNLFK